MEQNVTKKGQEKILSLITIQHEVGRLVSVINNHTYDNNTPVRKYVEMEMQQIIEPHLQNIGRHESNRFVQFLDKLKNWFKGSGYKQSLTQTTKNLSQHGMFADVKKQVNYANSTENCSILTVSGSDTSSFTL